MKMPARAVLLTLPLAASLSGCLSFGPKTPPSLLTLSPATPIAAGTTQASPNAGSITIAVPSVPQEIASLRVPVRSTPTTLAYLKDARWVEAPNRLFARLLSDAVTTRTGRIVVGNRMFGEPGATMTGELRGFGVDVATSSAVVTFDAAIVRQSGSPLEKRRFEASVPVAAVTPAEVGVALNQAANQVAGEVADWVGR